MDDKKTQPVTAYAVVDLQGRIILETIRLSAEASARKMVEIFGGEIASNLKIVQVGIIPDGWVPPVEVIRQVTRGVKGE